MTIADLNDIPITRRAFIFRSRAREAGNNVREDCQLGRKFVPTVEQLTTVKVMVGLGITEQRICLSIINPQTGKPISESTLRRAFRREIDTGQAELTALIGNMVINTALGRKPVGGEPIKSDAARIHAAMFYLECRTGWRRGVVVENVGKDGGPIQHQVETKEQLRNELSRIRERLAGGAAGDAAASDPRPSQSGWMGVNGAVCFGLSPIPRGGPKSVCNARA